MVGPEMGGPIGDGGMNRNPPRGYDIDSFDNPPGNQWLGEFIFSFSSAVLS